MTHSVDGYNESWSVQNTFDEARLKAEENFPVRRAHGELAEKVVQVRIAGATARRTYAYQVPFELDLEVGDWVTLPGNVVSEHGGFGIVKSFGREGYNGPLKSIRTRIPEPPELMIRMSVVKTKDRAADIYDQAVADGWTGDRLTALAVIGDQRLKARGVR